MPEWMRELAASHPFGADDRRGTTNLVDAAARARGAAEIRTGETISLARPLRGNDYNSTPEHPGFAHEIWYVPTPDGMGWGQDQVVLNCHGLLNTHIDGLNHVAVNDTFYGGRSVEDPDQGSVDVLARSGLLTRAVYVDVPDPARDRVGAAPGHRRGPRRRAWRRRRHLRARRRARRWTWAATASRRRAAIRSAARRATPTPVEGSRPRARAGSPSTASRCSSGTCSTPARRSSRTPRRTC